MSATVILVTNNGMGKADEKLQLTLMINILNFSRNIMTCQMRSAFT